MRIIAGKLKGSNIHLPKNKNTRPLKDLARESIFNLLIHSTKIDFQLYQANILDLFSGTGSFGLECLSREAKNVCFVEKEKNNIEILEKNIEKLKLKNKTKIIFDDVFNSFKNNYINKIKFNLIFLDPPFKEKNIQNLIKIIFNENILKKDGIIILHRNKNTNELFPNFFKKIEERNYGISKIIFGKLLN
tara:strand:- start:2140 stop:2709 length:570 start_codon:yes stop_codon:yes gene_type:complete